MIDFSISPALETTRQDVAAFMEQYVYPNESRMVDHEGLPTDLEERLTSEGEGAGPLGAKSAA